MGRIGLQDLLILSPGHWQDSAVPWLAAVRIGREVGLGHLVADHLPLVGLGYIVRCHRHVVVGTTVVIGLIGKEVVLVSVDVPVVRPEKGWAFASAESTAVAVGLPAADALPDQRPAAGITGCCSGIGSGNLGQKVLGLLLTQGHGLLVLVDAIVEAILLLHGGIDGSRAGLTSAVYIDPDLGLGEVDEIVSGDIHHPVVGQRGPFSRIGARIQVGGPIDHVLADLGVVVGLRRPGVAGIVGAHLDMPLLGPVGQIIRLPDLDVFGSVGLGTHETAQASGRIGTSGYLQIGGQHVELVAILGPHDEGIAKPLLALA